MGSTRYLSIFVVDNTNTMKFTPLFLALFALLLVSNRSVAQSFPATCDAKFGILGAVDEINDTIYACAETELTFADSSVLDGIISTRDWVFGDGDEDLEALMSPQSTHFYYQDGIYTATLKVGSDECPDTTMTKTVIIIGKPDYEVYVQEIDCAGNCTGEISVDLISSTNYLYDVNFWDHGMAGFLATSGVAIGFPYSNLCAGDYTAYITDQYECAYNVEENITLFDPAVLIATIDQGDTLNLCPSSGDTDITLTLAGGTGSYMTNWEASNSINQIDEVLMKFTPTAESLDRMYTVFIQDGNDCPATDSIYIRSSPSTLAGSVSVDADPCVNCTVTQYGYSTDVGLWAQQNTITTTSSGAFDFGSISNFSSFAIMANPDEVNHPMAVPTFYPQEHEWSAATIFNVCGETLNKHITIPKPLNFNGSNIFDGTVYYSQSWKTETDEDPIPLIDVVVEKTPPGQAQGRQVTNSNGGYTFTFVPNSDTIYTLYVNIPGIPVNSTYEIMADQGNQAFYLLDFCLAPDSSAIDACDLDIVVINNPVQSNEGSFVMYPNPSNGRFAIETGKFAETDTELQIVDLTGRVVFQKRYALTPATINMVNMAEGYYLVRMVNDHAADSSPIHVMRY